MARELRSANTGSPRRTGVDGDGPLSSGGSSHATETLLPETGSRPCLRARRRERRFAGVGGLHQRRGSHRVPRGRSAVVVRPPRPQGGSTPLLAPTRGTPRTGGAAAEWYRSTLSIATRSYNPHSQGATMTFRRASGWRSTPAANQWALGPGVHHRTRRAGRPRNLLLVIEVASRAAKVDGVGVYTHAAALRL